MLEPAVQLNLGRTGLRTSALVLGCSRIGSALTPLNRSESLDLIGAAFDLGIRHFDTANIYGQGDSERFLGMALQHRREQVCLSSKAGQRLSTRAALLAQFKTPLRWLLQTSRRGDQDSAHSHSHALRRKVATARQQPLPRCFQADAVEAALQASLKRLRTDHLDIFYLHSPDAGVLADDSLMSRLERLRERGCCRAIGVSCDDLASAWAAVRHPVVQLLQLAHDNSPGCQALLHTAGELGKPALLRGFMHHAAGTPPSGEALSQRFAAALQLPAFGGLIVGTTRLQHLQDNSAAFMRAVALAGAQASAAARATPHNATSTAC